MYPIKADGLFIWTEKNENNKRNCGRGRHIIYPYWPLNHNNRMVLQKMKYDTNDIEIHIKGIMYDYELKKLMKFLNRFDIDYEVHYL